MVLQYSHVKYFPNQDVYYEYYDYGVDLCDLCVESFATHAQTMLVDHLCEHYGDGIANWCRTFWSEARGRKCLAHSLYAGCNNTTWESKCHDATSRSSYCQTAHWGSSLASSATTSRPISVRSTYNASGKSASGIHSSAIPSRLRKRGGIQSAYPKTLSCRFMVVTAFK